MKNSQTRLALFVVGLIVIIAFPASAAWWDGGRGRGGAEGQKINPENMIAAKLKLTPDQVTKFKEQRERISQEAVVERLKIKELTEKLNTEMLLDQPDQSKIENYIKAIGTVRAEIWLKRMAAMLEMQKSLTSEQKQEFKKMFNHSRRAKAGKHQPKKGLKW